MMARSYLYTSDLAREAGIHPNTVRRYLDWGLLPPVERTPKGYRRFTQRHLDCLRVARLVYGGSFPGKAIRRSGTRIIQTLAQEDAGGALELAYQHLALVQAEQAQAEAAAALLERWAQGASTDATSNRLQIGQTAQLLGVTIDMLRNWERNGLLEVPRDPRNGYRQYRSVEISRLRVIRMLNQAGFSQMAILRMLLQLDQGQTSGLRLALDTPRPDEDALIASDRWLSTLEEQEQCAQELINLLEDIIKRWSEPSLV